MIPDNQGSCGHEWRYTMKIRRSYLILDILAAASFAGAYYIREFAKKKLGFVRWLNFNGAKLEESIPTGKVKLIMLAVILLAAIIALLLTMRRKLSAGVNGIVMCAAALAAAAYAIFATFTFDYGYSQAYFLIIPVLWIGAILLAVRAMIPPAKKAVSSPDKQTEDVSGE